MGDLVMQRQERLVEFLRSTGPRLTHDIAAHFDWSIGKAAAECEALHRRRLIESQATMSNDRAHGLAQLWNAID